AVRLLRAALANPTLADALRKSHYTVQPLGARRGPIEYTNTDLLIRNARWQILGGKTGYTDIARYCLVVAARLGERAVAMAFLGAEGKLTRFGDFHRVADWLMARPELKALPAPVLPPAMAAGGEPPAAGGELPAASGESPAPAATPKP